jgi:tetratricopeptide (TPR) repeat protein
MKNCRDIPEEALKAALPGKFLKGSFTRHEADLYSTLKVNDDILSEEPLLREILDVLTWSGPSSMGQSLLCALLGVKDTSQTVGALSLGVALRLLQKTPDTENYALHRLVREVRREDTPLAVRKEWAVKIAERLADWFQPLKRDFSDLPRFEAEIEHLRAWQENVREFAPKLASRLTWLQAYPPFHRGRYQDSHLLLETAKTLLEPSEDNDLELKANLLTDLCTINAELGRYEDARKCGEDALAIRLKLLGEHNSETALSFHNLGATLRVLGESEKSLAYHQKALAIWSDLYGENHIDTALALDGASASYRALGKNNEALKFAERALAVREKVLGHRHPDTAASFSQVGAVYAVLGDHSRALRCEEKALAIANDLFGVRSPIKATVLRNVASVYYGQKDLKRALEFTLEALAMRRELFGDEHPETLRLAVDGAAISCELGRVHQGFQLLDEFLKRIPKSHSQHDWLKERTRYYRERYSLPGFRQLPRKKR